MMNEGTPRENRMGTEHIPSLLMKMALPMMLSMLVQALYNVVDSIFVAKISEDALTALSVAFPLQNLMIAFAVGLGVGINSLLSRALGEQDGQKANTAAGNGLFLELCAALLFVFIGLVLGPAFVRSQTSSAIVADHGITYVRICIGAGAFCFIAIFYERMLQATGKTHLAMIGQLVGALINIVFDPILIFGLLGFPKLGVAGAAIATVFGQFCGAMVSLAIHQKKNREIRITLSGLRPRSFTVRTILSVGIPSIIMGSIGSVMTYCVNRILDGFSSTAVAVFGVYFKLQSFFFMPVFGLNNAMVPLIAYNYGARRPARMKQTVRWAVIYACSIMAVGLLLMQLMPDVFLRLFDASDDMLRIGVPRPADHQPCLCGGGLCHRAQLHLPGAGQGALQHVRLHRPAAGGSGADGMAAEPHRPALRRLVGLPHRGDHERAGQHAVPSPFEKDAPAPAGAAGPGLTPGKPEKGRKKAARAIDGCP